MLDEVEELRRGFPIDRVPRDDPRLDLDLDSSRLEAAAGGGRTIEEWLDGKGPAGSLTVKELHEAVGAVRRELERILAQNPAEALRELAQATLKSPHSDAIVKRLGWDGGGGCTQRAAAAMAGVSQQRVDQLERRLRVRLEEAWPLLPDGVERYIGETEKNLARP